jgi:phage/plasmid primase-like uncharacterized protein
VSHNKSSLIEFYQARFNSDPYTLLDFCSSDVAATAAEVQVDWHAISSDVQLNDQKLRGKIKTLKKGYNGKVAVYGSIKRTAGGIEYPHINFTTQKDGGYTATFDGFKALLEIYQQEGGQRIDSARQNAWAEQQAKKRRDRQDRLAALEAKEKKARELRYNEHLAYQDVFIRQENRQLPRNAVQYLGAEDGTAPYFQLKQIADIVATGAIELKRMRDWSGDFTAIALHDIHGEYKGLQRLYEKFKKYTVAVDDHQFDGAHCIIGDLESSDKAYATEGFATGATVFLATSIPVIVAMNADNLKKVLRDYSRYRPELQITNAADNDAFKIKVGNKGLMTAIELHKDFGIRSVYPLFDELDISKKPTDFNDLHCIAGLDEVKKQIKARKNRLVAHPHYFEYCLQRLSFSGHDNANDEALKAVGAGMMLSPIKYSTEQVYRYVQNSLPAGVSISEFKVRGRINWLAKGKLHRARTLRSFSDQALSQPNVNYIRLQGEETEHGNVRIPSAVVDLVEGLQGCIIIRSPMGSGKTDLLIQPIMHRAPKAAYIAHRVSLIGDASNRLNISNYQDTMASEMPFVSHLACCVNSIINPKFSNADGLNWFQTVDTLCIDEASQVMRHTTNGPVDNPVLVMDGLVQAMRASRRVLLCDADANDGLIDLCEMARPGEPIHIIEVTGTCKHISVLHTDINSAFAEVISLAKADKTVLVANDSAKDGKKMVEVLKQQKPDIRVMHVHKDSKADANVEAFLNDPNGECTKYDVIIYSPAISSGVSITVPHFSNHVSIFHGVVPPTDAVQMMRRDRTARQYVMGIGINNTQRDIDREAIYRGLVAADELTVDFEETSTEIILRRKKTIYDEVRLASIAEENRSRNDFANNLLLILIADRYVVDALCADDDAIAAAKQMKKWGKGIIEMKRIEMIMSQPTPDDDVYNRLSRSELRSEAEAAQIDRYHMETQLCVAEITPEVIAFYDDRGIKKVAAMELLQSSDAEAVAYDMAQIKNKVVLTRHNYKRATRNLYVKLFQQLGINPMTGEGKFTHKAARVAMSDILKDRASIELYNALKIGAYVNPSAMPKDPTTFIKNILERFGLVIHKWKSSGHNMLMIEPGSWAHMMRYVQLRKSNGISSLQFHDKDAPAALRRETGLDAQPIPPEAFEAELCGDGDTFQISHICTDEKYPYVRDRVIRIVHEFISGTEIPPEFAQAQLSVQDILDIDRQLIGKAELVQLLRSRYRERQLRLKVNQKL